MNWPALKEKLDLYERLMRLDKPIGILLLLWPTLWALWLSALGRPNWSVVWIFIMGTIHSARPGVVIGKKGEDIEVLKKELQRRMGVP